MAKRSLSLKMPVLALERFSRVALHRQLYLALKELILTRGLREGERLPSSRGLATGLGISRNTVVRAYEMLVEKNLTVAKVGSGTHVVMTLPPAPDFGLLKHAFVRHVAPTSGEGNRGGFQLGAILRGARYPLNRSSFLDCEGNTLYLYDVHLTS